MSLAEGALRQAEGTGSMFPAFLVSTKAWEVGMAGMCAAYSSMVRRHRGRPMKCGVHGRSTGSGRGSMACRHKMVVWQAQAHTHKEEERSF